jgi:hypothetical protein
MVTAASTRTTMTTSTACRPACWSVLVFPGRV